MKKFLVFAAWLFAIFLALTFACDGLNLALVRSSSGNIAYKMERLFGDLAEDEIPILGSSRAENHFVPSELGPDFFNYGIPGSPIGETLFLLRDLVMRKQSGLVVVNVDPRGFDEFEGLRGVFRGSYLLVARSADVRRRLPPGVVRGIDWLPGIRFQGRLRANLASAVNAWLSVTREIDRGAVLQKEFRTDDEWASIDKAMKPMDFSLPSEACQATLDEIARIVKARDGRLRVVFIIGPSTPAWRNAFKGGDALRKWVKDFNAKMADSHLEALDMFSDSDLERNGFANPTHLNRDGAILFSREVKRRISILHGSAQ